MALYSIERIGHCELGNFVSALVVAPNAAEALERVRHLTGPDAAKHFKVTRESTTGEPRLLWSQNRNW